MYSHVPHNDVSVNEVPHIRWWSHKVIYYIYVLYIYNIIYSYNIITL